MLQSRGKKLEASKQFSYSKFLQYLNQSLPVMPPFDNPRSEIRRFTPLNHPIPFLENGKQQPLFPPIKTSRVGRRNNSVLVQSKE
jgi:hypothetical protein